MRVVTVMSTTLFLLAASFGSAVARAGSLHTSSHRAGPAAAPVECSGQGQAGPLPAGEQTIQGVVTNGTIALPNIEVGVSSSSGGWETVTTGEDGSYHVDFLGDASYYVSFFDVEGLYQSGFYDAGPLALTPDTATPVVLSGSGATVDAALPGETYGSLTGTVTDHGDAAVVGAVVEARAVYFPTQGCASTEAPDGAYEITGLRTAVYRVKVAADGYPQGFYESSTGFTTQHGDATVVEVAGTSPVANIQFPELFSLGGIVRDQDGAPVDGLSIGANEVPPGASGSATTGANGTPGEFEIGGLVAGSYTVSTTDPNGIYSSGWYVGQGLQVGSEDDAVSVPVPGAAIDMRVTKAPTVQGLITDPDGAGVAGAIVAACDADETNCFEAQGGSEPGTEGLYTIGILVPGTYYLRAYEPNGLYPGGYITVGGGIARLIEDARAVVVDSDDVTGIDAQFDHGVHIDAAVTFDGAPADTLVGFCISDFACPESAGTSDGVASSPVMFADTYYVQAYDATFENLYWYVEGGPASLDFADATAITLAAGDTTSISMDIPSGGGTPTPEGEDVSVPLDDGYGNTPVTMTFDNVTVSGTSSLVISDTGPDLPDGFQAGEPTTYYDLTTTAQFDGSILVCVSYAGITFNDPTGLHLLHFDGTSWVDLAATVDPDTQTICGTTSSLSPFAIVERTYTFGGFFGPKAPPVFNEVKAGATVGVQFSLGGNLGLSIFADGTPTYQQISCTTGAPIGTATAATGTLKYNKKTGLYTFGWVTSKTWKNTCRELTLTFRDGSTASVWYRLRP
jgi:hypothetical protein